MTHPDDPRDRPSERPWQDGAAAPPPRQPESDQPTQAWQQYPDAQQYPDQPTQQYPTQQYPTQQYAGQQHAGQGYQQYPDSPPYPDQPTQQYGYPQQPYQQPNPTQALPPYDPNQQYAANQEYADQQFAAGQGYGPPPEEAGETAPGGKGPRKWIPAMVALAALAVIVLAGILVLTNQRSDPSTIASPSIDRPPSASLAPLPTIPPSQSPLAPSTPQDLVPGGIPEILGNAGAAIGTITAIDGSMLLLDGIDGAPVTVLVTPQTQILSLSGFDVSSLTLGSLVVVNGTSSQDGTITADMIVETPDLGG